MNFFSYESKPMQILMYVGDLIILNVLFLLCCIPIFTIGAAQTGLYTGVKTLQDPEDDTPISRAFFKGFRTGFKQITLAWGLLFIVVVVMAFVAYQCYAYEQLMGNAPLWMSIIALSLTMLFSSLVPLFHARFTCTPIQLIRNAWFLAVAHPIRSLVTAVLTWLPVIAFLVLDFLIFVRLTPIWFTLYYSTAFLFSFTYMKKPFQTLIDHFNETHEEGAPAPDEDAEEAEG